MRSVSPILIILLLLAPVAAAEPRVDAFGDPLPPGALARFGTARLHHASRIDALAFSPDGKVLAAGSHSLIRLWDTRSGKLVREWKAPEPFVAAVAWSPDGLRVFGVCFNYEARPGVVAEWDAASGELHSRHSVPAREPGRVFADALTCPDGLSCLHAGSDEKLVTLTDWPAAKVRHTMPAYSRIVAIGLTRDAGTIATMDDDGFVRITDTTTNKRKRVFFLLNK